MFIILYLYFRGQSFTMWIVPKGQKIYKEDKIMAYVITDECVSCGTCAGECPVEAIAEEIPITKSTRMYALSAEHAQAYVQPRLSQKSNLYGTYKKGSPSRTSFFYTYVSKLTEKPAPAEHSLLPLHFHVPAEMLQRPGRRIPVCRTRKECCRPC